MKKSFFLLLIASLLISGCVQTNRKVTPNVTGPIMKNVFISQSMPRLKLKIGDGFEYVGSIKNRKRKKFSDSTRYYTLRTEYYVFVQSDDNNHIDRLVLISLYGMSKGYWFPDLFSKIDNLIENEIINKNNKNYHSALWAGGPGSENWIELVENKGYIIDDTALIKGLARRVGTNNRHKIYIYYTENIKRCDQGKFAARHYWKNPNYLADSQKKFIMAFKQRADKAIKFLPYQR